MNNNIELLDSDKFFTITGKIHNIRQREYNGNITKYVMLEDVSNPDYPNYFEVEFYKDKADLVNAHSIGDVITASINFGGRIWKDRSTEEIKGAFFSLRGWKIEGSRQEPSNQQAQPRYAPTAVPAPVVPAVVEDDCPF